MNTKVYPLISIIIPVYNVETFLEECVYSVLNQTYSNLEILLIDDGSTDDSGHICDFLSKKDNRIKVIHEENGGLSDARNTGILKSKGKYISFIDSDDKVEPIFIERLYQLISIGNYQVSQVATRRISESGEKIGQTIVYSGNIKPLKNGKLFILNREEFIKELLLGNVHCAAWCNLYAADFFERVRFTKGKVNEDFLMWLDGIDHLNNIIISNECLYLYRNRDNSITASNSNTNKLYFDLIENSELWLRKIEDVFPQYKSEAYYNLFSVLLSYIKFEMGKGILPRYINYLNENLRILISNEYIAFSDKTFALFASVSPNLCTHLWCFIKKIKE